MLVCTNVSPLGGSLEPILLPVQTASVLIGRRFSSVFYIHDPYGAITSPHKILLWSVVFNAAEVITLQADELWQGYECSAEQWVYLIHLSGLFSFMRLLLILFISVRHFSCMEMSRVVCRHRRTDSSEGDIWMSCLNIRCSHFGHFHQPVNLLPVTVRSRPPPPPPPLPDTHTHTHSLSHMTQRCVSPRP